MRDAASADATGTAQISRAGWRSRTSANAARIVTCVNACAGMEDPAAEIDELRRQRDELLGLVKAVVYHSVPVTVNGTRCAAFPWVEYEAMVNKAKGGEK